MNKENNKIFDVLVVGGGHASIEAACAAARIGAKTAMVTMSKNTIGKMSCNPAVGGIGKGHIVFEISALGGMMPKLCRKSYLQAKMLNTSKGPAVQGLRLQIDKLEYNKQAERDVEKTKNLSIFEDKADEILFNPDGSVAGIVGESGKKYYS